VTEDQKKKKKCRETADAKIKTTIERREENWGYSAIS
jgi:hypothetical protein